MSSGDSTQDLVGRLNELVAEAREQGLLAQLAPALERLALDARQAPFVKLAHELPMRFGMIGDSPAMKPVFEMIEKVAPANVSVLIQGETGTGKELVARALHQYSRRSAQPFMAENCAAVPAGLLESELFGHAKGSFTGAIKDRAGHFVAADKGTVFLDEIGDMPLEMQAKLLRVLQDGEVRPVGSNKARKVDVRLIAATHRDLPTRCREGSFREDLYFRLNVITIHLPPLRERNGDIDHLIAFYAAKLGEEMGRSIEFDEPALAALRSWKWPGNVRELENEVRRVAAISSGRVGLSDLSERILQVT